MPTYNIKKIGENYLQTLVEKSDENLLELVGEDAAIEDPRKGRVEGKEAILQFAHDTKVWLEYRNVRFQHLRTTATDKRVGSEDILHMRHQGEDLSLPVSTVVCLHPETGAPEIHVYHSMWFFNRLLRKRAALFLPDHKPEGEHTDIIAEYFQALSTGSIDNILETVEADVYMREASGPPYVHFGHSEFAVYLEGLFSRGAPMIKGETITDDGKCVIMEFTVFGWKGVEFDPAEWQPGFAAYERSKYGKICSVRIQDEIDFVD